MRALFIFCCILFTINVAQAQSEVVKAVQLRDFIISADDSFDVEDFMHIVMTDSSFYQAFMNLKYYPHKFESHLEVFDKKEREKGMMDRQASQKLENEMRWVEINEETSNGKLYKRNGGHKYLTAEMYDELFFNQEKEQATLKIFEYEQQELRGNKIDKYKSQLKKMMFNPGQSISTVPLIGKKLAIFSDDMAKYYNYSVYSAFNEDSVYCYVFYMEAKPEYGRNKTVIKKMTSYFDKKNMKALNREYVLSNNTALFEFDIWMRVENKLENGVLLPKRIQYIGDWDIPFKYPEIIHFDIKCRDYELR